MRQLKPMRVLHLVTLLILVGVILTSVSLSINSLSHVGIKGKGDTIALLNSSQSPTIGQNLKETTWTQVSVNPNNGAGGADFSTSISEPTYQNASPAIDTHGSVPNVAHNADSPIALVVDCNTCIQG